MKVCVLMGSPRLEGNTATLVKPFIMELGSMGAVVDYITLEGKNLRGIFRSAMLMVYPTFQMIRLLKQPENLLIK